MSTDERDPVVARALAAVVVPEHRPGFWERLEEALQAEPVPPQGRPVGTPPPPAAPRAEPAAVPVPLEPRRGRRPAPTRRWLVAAAAVVALVGAAAGARLLAGSGDDPAGPADGPRVAVGTEGGTATTQPAPATADAVVAPRRVVEDFLDRLGGGDIAGARELLGPLSLTWLQSTQGDVDAFLGVASEGYGAWVSSTDRTFTTVPLEDGAVVVVVQGTALREGTVEWRADPVPVVRAADGTWQVELWAYGPGTELDEARLALVRPTVEEGDPVADMAGMTAGDQVHIAGQTAGRVWLDVGVDASGEVPPSIQVADPYWTARFELPGPAPDGGILLAAFRSATTFVAATWVIEA